MTTEDEKWKQEMAARWEQSRKAFAELDPSDVDAAVELGTDICKELGICCADKGKVMFQVFQRIRKQKSKEAAESPPVEQPEKTLEAGEQSA